MVILLYNIVPKTTNENAPVDLDYSLTHLPVAPFTNMV